MNDLLELITSTPPAPTQPAILIYYDVARLSNQGKFASRLLQEVLSKAGYAVELCGHGGDELTPDYLAHFHEVWFFLGAREESPELTEVELKALRAWMDCGGGVLLTGDHAWRPSEKEYRGIGRSIGTQIPRARHLRVWDSPPGDTVGDRRLNTTTRYKYEIRHSTDEEAQHLFLPVLDDGARHPIFAPHGHVKPERFPDHTHEGRVLAPTIERSEGDLYPAEWFAEGALREDPPPQPVVVAQGIAWERSELFDLMAAWDGAEIGVGRIVADSSFHHYVDYNLRDISNNERDWNEVKALYRNIAEWLLPQSIRTHRIGQALREVLAHPTIVDYENHGAREVGVVALDHLERELGGPLLAELGALVGPGIGLEIGHALARRGEDELSVGYDVHVAGSFVSALRRGIDTDDIETLDVERVLESAKLSFAAEIEAVKKELALP